MTIGSSCWRPRSAPWSPAVPYDKRMLIASSRGVHQRPVDGNAAGRSYERSVIIRITCSTSSWIRPSRRRNESAFLMRYVLELRQGSGGQLSIRELERNSVPTFNDGL